MPISVERSLLIIVVCGLVVFTTRAIPFVLFSGKKEIPEIVKYLGKVLPPVNDNILSYPDALYSEYISE